MDNFLDSHWQWVHGYLTLFLSIFIPTIQNVWMSFKIHEFSQGLNVHRNHYHCCSCTHHHRPTSPEVVESLILYFIYSIFYIWKVDFPPDLWVGGIGRAPFTQCHQSSAKKIFIRAWSTIVNNYLETKPLERWINFFWKMSQSKFSAALAVRLVRVRGLSGCGVLIRLCVTFASTALSLPSVTVFSRWEL